MFVIIAFMLLFFAAPDDFLPITPENVTELQLINRIQIEGGYANQIAFDPVNTTHLAVSQQYGVVTLYDVVTGEKLHILSVASGEVNSLAYSPDGAWLITADKDGEVNVWDVFTFNLLQTLTVESEIPVRLDTADDGIIAVGYDTGTVRLWNVNTGEMLLKLYGYRGGVGAIDILSDASKVMSLYWGEIFIYDIESIEFNEVFVYVTLEDWEMNDIAFYPSSHWRECFSEICLASAANHGSVKFWSPYGGRGHITWGTEAAMSYPTTIAFSSDGSMLAIGGKATMAGGGCEIDINPCSIKIVHTRFSDEDDTFEELISLDVYKGQPIDVIFSADDRFLASVFHDGLILVWGISST